MRKMGMNEIKEFAQKKYGKDVVIIEYVHRWGGSFQDTCFWMATINGEVEDYHLKEVLIKEAEKNNRKWVVLRHHRDKTSSIAESSQSERSGNK